MGIRNSKDISKRRKGSGKKKGRARARGDEEK